MQYASAPPSTGRQHGAGSICSSVCFACMIVAFAGWNFLSENLKHKTFASHASKLLGYGGTWSKREVRARRRPRKVSIRIGEPFPCRPRPSGGLGQALVPVERERFPKEE